MSKNIAQVYSANPITSNASTDLMYFGQSPYGVGNDAAMLFSDFSAQFGAPYTAAALTRTNDTNVTLTLGGSPTTALVNAASLTLGWTGTLGVSRGGTGVGSVTTSPTASSFAGWDANKNLSANSFIDGYTTTATAAGTTTLLVGSTQQQFFTGSTTQTVVLPVTSTLVLGQSYLIVNKSTGIVTVQSSGANTIQAMAANSSLTVTCILTSGTGTASWAAVYAAASVFSAGGTNSAQGPNATAAGTSSLAVGTSASASGNNALAIGASCTATQDSSVAVGSAAHATGAGGSVALGQAANASGQTSICIGFSSACNQESGIAIGTSASSSGSHSVCIGTSTTSSFAGAFVFGDSATNPKVPTANNQFQMTFAGGYYFNLTNSSLAVSIDANGNLINVKGTADQSYSLQAPSTGFSITIGAGVKTLILNPAGTLATGTITLPAAPINGQEIRVCSSQIITSLTVSPNSGQSIVGAPTTLAVGGGFGYIYNLSGTTWYRLY